MLLETTLEEGPKMGSKVQFYAVQGTVVVDGAPRKFSVKVSEQVSKGIASKDQSLRRKAFADLATRVKESFSKKQSQTGKGAVDSKASISERDFTITGNRRV